jgi:hypothetical protein
VLIIPEDPTLDQHIVKPVVERVFRDLGLVPRVDVLTDPHLSSASQALNRDTVQEIVEDNRMTDVFILVVDRDCDRQNHAAKLTARVAEHEGRLVGVLACEEVEVWALALHRQALGAAWSEVRRECDPKERFWDPFVVRMGWLTAVGKGRKKAMRGLGAGWSGLLQVCPEIAAFRDELEQHLRRRV